MKYLLIMVLLSGCDIMAPPIPYEDAATRSESETIGRYFSALPVGVYAPTGITIGMGLTLYAADGVVRVKDNREVFGTVHWYTIDRDGICTIELYNGIGWACGYNVTGAI